MIKEAKNIFEVIDEVNKDLGEFLFIPIITNDGNDDPNSFVAITVDDKILCKSQSGRVVGRIDEVFVDKDEVICEKKKILSWLFPFCSANPYPQIINTVKKTMKRIRSFHKVLIYLGDRYGVEFDGYANSGAVLQSYVIFPMLKCRFNPLFKFAHYYNLWFDENDEISKKSLDAYCKKMDKIIERMKCLWKAFGNMEYSAIGKNFYALCDIKRNRSGEWAIKFPYTLRGKKNYFYGEETEMLTKLMKMYHYKDTNYCIWSGTSPDSFEMMRELIK